MCTIIHRNNYSTHKNSIRSIWECVHSLSECKHEIESLYLKSVGQGDNKVYLESVFKFCRECSTIFVPQQHNIQYGRNSVVLITNVNNLR